MLCAGSLPRSPSLGAPHAERFATTLIAHYSCPPSPSHLCIPLQGPSMASAYLNLRLAAPQARPQCPRHLPVHATTTTPATYPNIPRKQGSRRAGLGLLTPTTTHFIHPLRHFYLAHTFPGAIPSTSGLKPVDEAHRCSTKPDNHAEA